MPCDTVRLPTQTLEDRKREIREKTKAIDAAMARGQVKVAVGKQGAVAFSGISEEMRGRMTDACIYRRIMATGSSQAKAAIARAEAIAGRGVDKMVVGHGVHSHDGGRTWHKKG